MFEQRPRNKGTCHFGYPRRKVSGVGKSKCKDPEARTCLLCSANKVIVIKVEKIRGSSRSCDQRGDVQGQII